MKKLSLFALAVAALIGFTACSSSSDDSPAPTPREPLKELPKSVLGSWDRGYVTSVGDRGGIFLVKKNNEVSSSPRRKAPGAALNTETLYFTSTDGATKATLLINKEDNRPLQFIMKDGVLNFSFLSDEVLELVFTNGTEIKYIDQIPYNKAALDAALAAADYKNELQSSLFFFANVTDVTKLASYPTVVAAVLYFREIVNLHYEGSSTVTAEEAGITVGSDGVATEAAEAEKFEEEYVEKVYSKVTIWTGKASFKVGGSSCTLSGTVFCANPTFATAGKVGIVCDKDPAKLLIGTAEFEETAELKDGQNFDVDIRGLNAETTYYYRAFYQFLPTADPSGYDIILDPAQKVDDMTEYDNTTKSFTTGIFQYTVDVVMLLDISGSMSDELGMVKENVRDFPIKFKEKCDEKNIKLLGLTAQAIPYSDINVDGKYALNKSDVYNMLDETEHSAFETYVNNIDLTYGGDTPESALEALATGFQRDSWGADDGLHRQIFILWTDATYKTYNEGICKLPVRDIDNNIIEENCERNPDGSIMYDDYGEPIGKPMYVGYSYDQVKAMWDGMPSGRRMILFAPYGTSGYSNEGDWSLMDEWKNVYHEDIYGYTWDFNKALDYIIEEMIGKEKTTDVPTDAKARKNHKKYPEPVNIRPVK